MAEADISVLKSVITSLLTSTSNTLTIRTLCDDFKEFEGYELPFKRFGYTNPEDYLRSMSDTVVVHGKGPDAILERVPKKNSAHIAELVSKSKRRCRSRSRSRAPRFEGRYQQTPSRCFVPSMPPHGYRPVQVYQSSPNSRFVPVPNYTHPPNFYPSPDPRCQYYPNRTFQGPMICVPNYNDPRVINWMVQNNQHQANSPALHPVVPLPSAPPRFVPEQLPDGGSDDSESTLEEVSISANRQLDLASVHEQPISAEQKCRNFLNDRYFNRHSNEPSFVQSSAQNDLNRSERKCPDYLNDKSLTDHWNVPKADLSSVENGATGTKPKRKNPHVRDGCHPNVPEHIRDKLKKLISRSPDGIWCTKLPLEYKKMFKEKLSYTRYNYRSLIEMCMDVPEIISCTQPTTDDFLLYDATKPEPKIRKVKAYIPRLEQIGPVNILDEMETVNWDTVGPLIVPSDVMRPGDSIDRFPIKKFICEEGMLHLEMGEVYDISKFWIMEQYGDLKPLMEDLQNFFKYHFKTYFIPEQLLVEGLYCASMYSGLYHRCVIVNLLTTLEGYIRVYYIDYGTVENVYSNEIWYLPTLFAKIPSQAIRARLADIYPPVANLPWASEATNRFKKLVKETTLVAEIIKIHDEDGILDIYLTDVSDEGNEFHINDLLVGEGLAIYYGQEQTKPTYTDPSCVVNVDHFYLYPTFDELESGCAPSVSDMNYIIENKLPMHQYMPQYFDSDFHEDVHEIDKSHEEHHKQMEVPKIEPNKIDDTPNLSIFPSHIAEIILDILEEDNSHSVQSTSWAGVESLQLVKQVVKPTEDQVSETYNCSEEYKYNLTENAAINCESDSSNKSGSSQGNATGLETRLKQLNLNNLGLQEQNANSFFNDDNVQTDKTTEPRTIQLQQMISKSSEEKFSDIMLNNLNSSPNCFKTVKQVNIERANTSQNPIQRPPPGFTNMGPPMDLATRSNPYYHRHPQQQWGNFFGQNQFGMAMMPNNGFMGLSPMNFPPQYNPTQYQYNVQVQQPPNGQQRQPFSNNSSYVPRRF